MFNPTAENGDGRDRKLNATTIKTWMQSTLAEEAAFVCRRRAEWEWLVVIYSWHQTDIWRPDKRPSIKWNFSLLLSKPAADVTVWRAKGVTGSGKIILKDKFFFYFAPSKEKVLKCIIPPPFPFVPPVYWNFFMITNIREKHWLLFLVICLLCIKISFPPRTCMFHSSKAWHVACEFDIFLINTY